MASRADERMALEATHSDRVVRDEGTLANGSRRGAHAINDFDLSQLLNFGQIVHPMACQETPRKALKTH